MAIVCPLCPQDACCHFTPKSPDPFIKKDADMTLAKFGHLNHIIDMLCCISDDVAALESGSVQSIVYCGETLPEVAGVVTIPAIVVDGVTITGTGCELDPLTVVASPGLSQHAYFWQTVADVAGTIAANDGKALFQTASSNNTAGLTTVAASGDIIVGLTAGGVYDIIWDITGAEPNAFGVFINGALQLGTVYGSGAGTQQNTGFTTLLLVAGDTVSLRSVNAPAAITLQLAGTTNTAQIVTSIKFLKIA